MGDLSVRLGTHRISRRPTVHIRDLEVPSDGFPPDRSTRLGWQPAKNAGGPWGRPSTTRGQSCRTRGQSCSTRDSRAALGDSREHSGTVRPAPHRCPVSQCTTASDFVTRRPGRRATHGLPGECPLGERDGRLLRPVTVDLVEESDRGVAGGNHRAVLTSSGMLERLPDTVRVLALASVQSRVSRVVGAFKVAGTLNNVDVVRMPFLAALLPARWCSRLPARRGVMQ